MKTVENQPMRALGLDFTSECESTEKEVTQWLPATPFSCETSTPNTSVSQRSFDPALILSVFDIWCIGCSPYQVLCQEWGQRGGEVKCP